MRRRKICPRCDGRGWLESVEVDTKVAPTGRLQIACKRCGGSRTISQSFWEWLGGYFGLGKPDYKPKPLDPPQPMDPPPSKPDAPLPPAEDQGSPKPGA